MAGVQTVSEHVVHAEDIGDVDLSTGLSEEDRARREAFLQGLLPQERVEEYVREVAQEDQRAARAAQRAAQEEAEWATHAASDSAAGAPVDPVADAVAEAVEEVAAVGSGGARVGAARSVSEEASSEGTRSADTDVVPPVATDASRGMSTETMDDDSGADALKAAAAAMRVPVEMPASVRSEVVPEDDAAVHPERGAEGVTIDTTAEPSVAEAASGGAGAARAPVRRRGRDFGTAPASTGEIGLDDLIADDPDDAGGTTAGFDDTGFVDTWMRGSSSAGAETRQPQEQPAQRRAEPAAAPAAGAAAAPAEDATMDAISRALKAGVDKETLKRYIDEVSEQVADSAGAAACCCICPAAR